MSHARQGQGQCQCLVSGYYLMIPWWNILAVSQTQTWPQPAAAHPPSHPRYRPNPRNFDIIGISRVRTGFCSRAAASFSISWAAVRVSPAAAAPALLCSALLCSDHCHHLSARCRTHHLARARPLLPAEDLIYRNCKGSLSLLSQAVHINRRSSHTLLPVEAAAGQSWPLLRMLVTWCLHTPSPSYVLYSWLASMHGFYVLYLNNSAAAAWQYYKRHIYVVKLVPGDA